MQELAFETCELKNGRETGGANSSNLDVLLAWTGNVHLCASL